MVEPAILNITIPTINDSLPQIQISLGEPFFILGANGTGKSSLIHHIYSFFPGKSRRISAHRQTWFSSGTTLLSPPVRKRDEGSIMNADLHPDSRWKESHAEGRANIAIYDLLDAENVRARAITAEVDQGNLQLAMELSKQQSPLAVINNLFQLSQMPLFLTAKGSERILVSKSGSVGYSIAELSDGERNALLLAANIMTAKSGTLFLVDEPERHLHRAIVSPLLLHLFSRRQDCYFVISTHDIQLCIEHAKSSILLMRACTYSGKKVSGWDFDIIKSESEIDEDVKRDIFGPRRKLILVEGTRSSLDASIYEILFPDCSILVKASCRDVMQGIRGINLASDIQWVSSWGIIDSDGRLEEEKEKLKLENVFAINCYSVESLYYHPEIIQRIAKRQADVIGGDPKEKISRAVESAIAAVKPHIQRLSQRIAEKRIRNICTSQLPTREDIQRRAPLKIEIDVPALVTGVVSDLRILIDKSDYGRIASRFPIRETPALDQIAEKLDFSGRSTYEQAVLKLVSEEQEAREVLYGLLGGLKTEIDAVSRSNTQKRASALPDRVI